MLRAFGGRAAAAPVVLPLAMVAYRLSISRRHGTNSRARLRLHRTFHAQVHNLPKFNFDFRLRARINEELAKSKFELFFQNLI